MKPATGNGPMNSGFSVVEIMVALAIIAILMGIALPGYRHFVLKSHRIEALRTLLEIQSAQERYFVQHNRYAASLAAPPPDGLGIPALTSNGYYTLELDADAADGAGHFLARALAQAGSRQTEDLPCISFSVNELGDRHARDSAGADRTVDCWR